MSEQHSSWNCFRRYAWNSTQNLRNDSPSHLHKLQRQDAISPVDYNIMLESLDRMLVALRDAAEICEADTSSVAIQVEATHKVYTGLPGRPRIEIEPGILDTALQLRGPSQLANTFQCHPRTIRRRALELGLVEPGRPVYTECENEETGQRTRLYNTRTTPDSTPTHEEDRVEDGSLTDQELDKLLCQILQNFPSFGRRMLTGHLRYLGHDLPRERIRDSFERVQGMPAWMITRPLARRPYRVAGPNALWHHDGQHGSIHWRIVIHGFVDGHSRMVTGIRASDNNRPDTVVTLFHRARLVHGTPSRIRGDHGTENLHVAEWMEANFGVERGSYIWGRSVHNIRIERLWRDVTRGFGAKWKVFFQDLEIMADLRPNWDAHIWLLHYLFLDAINEDAIEWAETWNHHTVTIRGGTDQSPREMFFFGQLENGWRDMSVFLNSGQEFVDVDPLGDEEVMGYGIDWDDVEDRDISCHHTEYNDGEDNNIVTVSRGSNVPLFLSLVEVPTYDCPLTDDQFDMLNDHIASLPYSFTNHMGDRKRLWIQVLRFCREVIFGVSNGV
ncbi:hypothetical protein PQX77_013176 [Marasmius sp. AFHP31]|nr:hypothetical protein PQX77_013176 [Marasmius sp. AFHP31]